MGYSKAQKARTHNRIVAIASRRFREKGLAGFGIAELMKEAGLVGSDGDCARLRATREQTHPYSIAAMLFQTDPLPDQLLACGSIP